MKHRGDDMKTRTFAYSPVALAVALLATRGAAAQTELQPAGAAPAAAPAPAPAAAPAPTAAPAPAAAPTEEPSTSKMDLYVPPPPPPLARVDYMHNGLYVRMSTGPGAGFVGGTAGGDIQGSFAFGLDAMVG